MTVFHDDSCGCRYRLTDAPDDQWIGQVWELVRWCKSHLAVQEVEAECDLTPLDAGETDW